jgi:hypothetical protein
MALTKRSYSLSATVNRNSGTSRKQNRNNSINISNNSSLYSGSIILNAHLPDKLSSAYPVVKKKENSKSPLPSPRVPIELLDRIVVLMLTQTHRHRPTPIPPSCSNRFPTGCVSKNIFKSVAAFSLASSSFRQVALRRWFEHLEIDSPRQCIKLSKFITVNKGSSYVQYVVRILQFYPCFNPCMRIQPLQVFLVSFCRIIARPYRAS